MTTGFSKRDGFVRLVMTEEDYGALEAIMAAGFMDLQRRGGLQCALRALETIDRVTEGDPEREKTFPAIGKAIAEVKARIRMLEVLAEMAETEQAAIEDTVQ